MSVRFVANPAFDRELQAEPEFVASMRKITTTVAVHVREAAPVHTGYYKRHVRPMGTDVIAFDPFGHLVEFGSVNNPPYAPLRRGVIAAGLRLQPSRI